MTPINKERVAEIRKRLTNIQLEAQRLHAWVVLHSDAMQGRGMEGVTNDLRYIQEACQDAVEGLILIRDKPGKRKRK